MSEPNLEVEDGPNTEAPFELASLRTAQRELRQALAALALEIPNPVWLDVNMRAENFWTAAWNEIDRLRRRPDWPADLHDQYLVVLSERDDLQAQVEELENRLAELESDE